MTAACVAEALRAMPGIEVQTGIGKTGVKAMVNVALEYMGSKAGK